MEITPIVIAAGGTVGFLLLFLLVGARGASPVISAETRAQLEREGVQFLEEGVPLTIRLRNFRAPGRYSSYSVKAARGTFAITNSRIAAYGGRSHTLIDVPLDHPKLNAVQFATSGTSRLKVAFEAADFDEAQSGSVELTFGLAEASRALRTINDGVRRQIP